ncbi:MAG: hypothetical protein HC802_05425 [Caldilineaceae bacterium]|nr:hypothetical protein [Caldilineaceae bacterium]
MTRVVGTHLGSRRFLGSLLLFAFALFLSGCGSSRTSSAQGNATLGERIAGDPMTVAETYLQQYQPGPMPRLFQTTRIYDRHGEILGEFFDEGRRTWVRLEDVSPHLINATIATEDASFYMNSGVDPVRIAGAAIKNLQEGEIVSGASTITMQLARNLFLTPEQRYDQSVDRKVREADIARELTTLYTKDELLEIYLNLLNYGQLAYGPEAASWVYFGKSAQDLTLAEASFLAGIPQQPANLNPYQNFDGVKARQRIVLDLMVRHGFLKSSQADQAFAEQLELVGDPAFKVGPAPHFTQYIYEQLVERLGEEPVRRGGLRVQTTLDAPMQQMAQQVVAENVAELQPIYDLSNAALVALKPQSGEILAMVGSADFANDEISGQVNVAVRPRQPGSAIKPILYATALEDNLVSPASVLWDVPVTYTIQASNIDGLGLASQFYRPNNYDNEFRGAVTVRNALANSYNVPTVKLLSALGVDRMLESARAMGVKSLVESDEWYGLSLTLGGGEVTLLDLTTAFHTLANQGQYQPPQSILSIQDAAGNEIEQAAPEAATPALSQAAAFLVTDILSDNAARAAAFGSASPLEISRPAAVKTGTTTDWRDNWTVGYTQFLVAGIWAGNSDGRPMRSASGVTGAAPIWHDFMEAVLADPHTTEVLGATDATAGDWEFTPSEDVRQVDGCPPGLACRTGGEFYTQAWLEATGAAGPFSDSVVRLPGAPVYVARDGESRLVGFCMQEGAAERTALTVVNRVRKTSDEEQPGNPVAEPGGESLPGELALEIQHVLAWGLRNGSAPIHLGPCASLGDLSASALAMEPNETDAGLRVLVDLAAAAEPGIAETASPDALEVALIVGGESVPSLGPGGNYVLAQPVYHDTACPGEYVLGRVLDATGAPLAGVRLSLFDQSGNQSIAFSKDAGDDMGRFDFPLFSASPQEFFLNVVDEAGNPLSSTVVLQHRQGEEPDAACHHIVFRQS